MPPFLVPYVVYIAHDADSIKSDAALAFGNQARSDAKVIRDVPVIASDPNTPFNKAPTGELGGFQSFGDQLIETRRDAQPIIVDSVMTDDKRKRSLELSGEPVLLEKDVLSDLLRDIATRDDENVFDNGEFHYFIERRYESDPNDPPGMDAQDIDILNNEGEVLEVTNGQLWPRKIL